MRIGTLGVSAVGAYPHAAGRWDALLWSAVQTGHWYGQRHRAFAAAGAAWGINGRACPGGRGCARGVDYASGDASAVDDAHGTFFPMLPSGNQFVAVVVVRLDERGGRLGRGRVTPASAVDAQVAVHHVRLANRRRLVVHGQRRHGARRQLLRLSGPQHRSARGTLGTIVEGEVTWRPARWWTLRGYAGRMAGGDAVRNVFAGRRLVTAWLESLVSF